MGPWVHLSLLQSHSNPLTRHVLHESVHVGPVRPVENLPPYVCRPEEIVRRQRRQPLRRLLLPLQEDPLEGHPSPEESDRPHGGEDEEESEVVGEVADSEPGRGEEPHALVEDVDDGLRYAQEEAEVETGKDEEAELLLTCLLEHVDDDALVALRLRTAFGRQQTNEKMGGEGRRCDQASVPSVGGEITQPPVSGMEW